MRLSILARHPCHYERQHMNFRPVTFAVRKQTDYDCIAMPFDINATLQTTNWAKLSAVTFSCRFKVKYPSDWKKGRKFIYSLPQGNLLQDRHWLQRSLLQDKTKGRGNRVSWPWQALGAFCGLLTEKISKQTWSIQVKQTIIYSLKEGAVTTLSQGENTQGFHSCFFFRWLQCLLIRNPFMCWWKGQHNMFLNSHKTWLPACETCKVDYWPFSVADVLQWDCCFLPVRWHGGKQ